MCGEERLGEKWVGEGSGMVRLCGGEERRGGIGGVKREMRGDGGGIYGEDGGFEG